MENITPNKAKFFAQYYGQEIVQYPKNEFGLSRALSILNEYHFNKDNSYLELTPLSKITFEHAIEVAKIACGEKVFRQRENIIDTPDGKHKDVTYVLVERFINHPEIMQWKEYALIQIDHDDCDIITGIKDENGC